MKEYTITEKQVNNIFEVLRNIQVLICSFETELLLLVDLQEKEDAS